VVEGERAIRRALENGWHLESVLLLESKAGVLGRDLEGREPEKLVGAVLVAPREIVEAVTGFPFHRGVLAICRRRGSRDFRELAASTTLALVVEAVNDHENMGALFRNAAAFGAGAVLLDPSCCDPLYRRSVRVSLGNVLAVPFATAQPWPGSLEAIRGAGFTLVALTPSGETSLDDAARRCAVDGKVAVMVGSEDQGLSEGALAAAGIRVRIPMAEGVDSLNVATAAAVALSRLRPGSGAHLV
jgi:tRNA G18 (ribose-2'-O)-methylase SpoU